MLIVALDGLSDVKVQPALAAFELGGRAVDRRGRAEIGHRGGRLRHLLDADERGELRVHLHLLLDLGELDELLGELVGVERLQRVLVLELRGQQGQERSKLFAIVVASLAVFVRTPALLLGAVPVAEATGLECLRACQPWSVLTP